MYYTRRFVGDGDDVLDRLWSPWSEKDNVIRRNDNMKKCILQL